MPKLKGSKIFWVYILSISILIKYGLPTGGVAASPLPAGPQGGPPLAGDLLGTGPVRVPYGTMLVSNHHWWITTNRSGFIHHGVDITLDTVVFACCLYWKQLKTYPELGSKEILALWEPNLRVPNGSELGTQYRSKKLSKYTIPRDLLANACEC